MTQPTRYTNLNQAQHLMPALAEGTTKIWYFTTTSNREIFGMMFGYEQEKISARSSILDDIKSTHVMLGSIACIDLDEIFVALQGESYSPNGEAYSLIKSKKLGHTSMSIGDIIEIDGVFHVVGIMGFSIIQ